MKAKSFEEEMCLDQQRVNQTAWEQKYFFEENGFTKEDLVYEEEMRSQYWSEYMTDLEWRNSCLLNDNIGQQRPPRPVGLFFNIPLKHRKKNYFLTCKMIMKALFSKFFF